MVDCCFAILSTIHMVFEEEAIRKYFQTKEKVLIDVEFKYSEGDLKWIEAYVPKCFEVFHLQSQFSFPTSFYHVVLVMGFR